MSKYSELLTKELLENLYLKYNSISGISRELNIPIGTVSRYLKKFGIAHKHFEHYSINENALDLDNEISLYLAGFIAADGSVSKNSSNITIELSHKDESHLYKIRDLFESSHPISSVLQGGGKYESRRLSITNEHLYNKLKRYNIVPNKTATYTFPSWLITNDLVHHFMRGYVDGDGSIKIKKNMGKFEVMGTEKFVSDFEKILRTGASLAPHKLYKYGNIWRLEIGGNHQVERIIKFLYKDATIFLERKKATADKILTLKTREFISYEQFALAHAQAKNRAGVAKILNCTRGNVTNLYKKFGDKLKERKND